MREMIRIEDIIQTVELCYFQWQIQGEGQGVWTPPPFPTLSDLIKKSKKNKTI